MTTWVGFIVSKLVLVVVFLVAITVDADQARPDHRDQDSARVTCRDHQRRAVVGTG